MRKTFRQFGTLHKIVFKARIVFFVGQTLSNQDWISQTSIEREALDQRDIVQTGQFCAHFAPSHSSEIRGLRSTKCSSETLQNLLYFMYKKMHVVFFVFYFMQLYIFTL